MECGMRKGSQREPRLREAWTEGFTHYRSFSESDWDPFRIPQSAFPVPYSLLCFCSFWYSLYSLDYDEEMPTSVLYATSARIGGVGLDAVALETLRGIDDRLGLATSFRVKSPEFDRIRLVTLRFHLVRRLSNLERKYYYGAKKRAVDAVAARYLKTGRFDLFHGWSGE